MARTTARTTPGPARLKAANAGGQPAPFEAAFANLAHAYLKEKAPLLLDYEVGFQLVDRNQDNTKAVGVFGFQVGTQWLYAPVFFINGDLKGHELLYIKSQDAFVPMKENWVNYVLNRRPHVLGESTGRDLAQLGVMPASLYQLARSPHKFAAAGGGDPLAGTPLAAASPWARAVLPDIAHFATRNPLEDPKYASLPDLPTFLKDAGVGPTAALVAALRDYPVLRDHVDRYYGLDKIAEAARAVVRARPGHAGVLTPRRHVKAAGRRGVLRGAPPAGPVDPRAAGRLKVAKTDGVTVKVNGEEVAPGDLGLRLDDAGRETLLRAKVVVVDRRDDREVTLAYTVETTNKLSNPPCSGLYDVLIKPGEYARCLVLLAPYSGRGKQNYATVVRVDGDKRHWRNTHASNVWVADKVEGKAFDEWWDALPAATAMRKGGLYAVLAKDLSGTVPFEVGVEVGGDRVRSHKVRYRDWAANDRPGYLPRLRPRDFYLDELAADGYASENTVTLTDKDGVRLKLQRGELFVPRGARLLALAEPPEGDDGHSGFEDLEQLRPGNLADVEAHVLDKTAGLKAAYDRRSGRYALGGRAGLAYEDALEALVAGYGLREKQARHVLAETAAARAADYRLVPGPFYKTAAPWDLLDNGPTAPAQPDGYTGADPMGTNLPAQYYSEYNLPVADMATAMTDRSAYDPSGPGSTFQGPDQASVQTAAEAARLGQREVFDTAMLGSLLKATRDDSLVDRYMGDLMKGLDRLGRILFQFYWHRDRFEARYGRQDMVELEDGLRNSFEALGDIVLFLRQKTVDPNTQDAGAHVDLTAVSSM